MPSPVIPAKTLGQAWGEAIAARRRTVGFTQAQLADLCGVEQQTVSRWELGVAVPRDQSKIDLARVLGTNLGDLFAYPENLGRAS